MTFADVLYYLDDLLWGKPFLVFVLFIGLYFTLRAKFFPFAHFGHIMKNTLGSVTSKEANNKKEGMVSPFEAVCIAIGGCVGCGNIGGVASAIAVGGPGSIFWLWLWAFFGMMIKCVEITLGCHYRSRDEKGNYFGGATYFMEKGIYIQQGIKFGAFLAFAFGIGFIAQFFGGSQAYTISEILNVSFGINMILVTVLYSIALWYIIWKGTPRIAKFATKVVPFMTVGYVIFGLIIIIINIPNLPSVFGLIFSKAFTPTAAVGGFTGAAVSKTIAKGLSRSMNSNEAGQGSSPLIHGSANCEHPVKQGLWGSFEVFTDTLIVCSVTALSILCTGAWTSGKTGATLTILAYTKVFGQFGSLFIGIMAIFFGLTTTSGWFTYYCAVINHGLRYKPVLRDKILFIFKLVFPIPNLVIVSAITLGGYNADVFWAIVDITLIVPVFTNLIGLFLLRNKFFELFNDYKARYLGDKNAKKVQYIFYEDDPVVAKHADEVRAKVKAVADAAYAKKR
ncbi:MAG: sodium:alanine symporter family protein [Clostridia bacterium]|jgi:AGCS family alanine or glycine:cation symporter|nr:sodium:alanine symporter family protein [Clostridia bacterium]MCI2000970.1 sodium:alanine symporter family protein [Clostridia bacterium]MCI2015754.1 sodium:alanine symporter family protein [Clostridia bacterium]